MKENPEILEIRKRNKVLFKRLFDKYYKELTLFACHYLEDLEESEDLVAEIFISLWKHADTTKIYGSMKKYFYNQVQIKCSEQLKVRRFIEQTQKWANFGILPPTSDRN